MLGGGRKEPKYIKFRFEIDTSNILLYEPGNNIMPITLNQAGPVDSTRVEEEVKGGQGTPVPP